MTIKLSNYLEKYGANDYAAVVCEKVFRQDNLMHWSDIIQLTERIQVNFFLS